ncbi:MAG: hypothetical protein ACR2FY_06735 [Pirellulaceae bacterium]
MQRTIVWFWAQIVVVSIATCGSFELASSQEPPITPPLRGLVDLLQGRGVMEDLDIVDFQKEKIEKVLAERRGVTGAFGATLDAAPLEKRKDLLASFRAALDKADNDVAESLLPAQIERLKQIRFQLIARNDATTYGLKNKQLALALELTEVQKAEIDAKAADVNKTVEEKLKKLKAEIAKVKSDAREELIKVLTPVQRKKYTELYGRPFEE